jgi:hypothetical protein
MPGRVYKTLCNGATLRNGVIIRIGPYAFDALEHHGQTFTHHSGE